MSAPIIRSTGRVSYLLALVISLGCLSLVSCDDGSDSLSRPRPPPDPEPGKMDALVYQAFEEPDHMSLYKINRHGESTLLAAGKYGSSVSHPGFQVSPDTQRLIYSHELESGQSALTLLNIDSGEPEVPGTIAFDEGYSPSQLWLPDSQGVVYTVFQHNGFISSLWLARLGEEHPVQLIGPELGMQARIQYAVSSDGSRLVALLEYVGTEGGDVAESASLYLVELTNQAEPMLIDTVSGDANTFFYAWSPVANELLYQRRYYTGLLYPGIANNFAGGPLVLMNEESSSEPLREVDVDGYDPWAWLDGQWIRTWSNAGGFDVIGTGGSVLGTYRSAVSAPVASPDVRELAFLAASQSNEMPIEVNVLDLDSGSVRAVGPGSWIYILHFHEGSELRWSPDGTRLAWNRTLDYEQTMGEIYAHELSTGESRLITTDLGSAGQLYPLRKVSWLPEGNVLQYLVRDGAGFEFTVTDLAGADTRVVGQLDILDCYFDRAWWTNEEVLWHRCGDGVYLSRLGNRGAVTETRVLDRNVGTFKVTSNRQLAVMQPEDPTGATLPNWQMYDFIQHRMIELEGTGGVSCCGSLLQ